MNTIGHFYSKTKIAKIFIAKKGKRYFTIRNGELALTGNMEAGIAFKTEKELLTFMDNISVDDRNARTIGKSYSTTDVTFPR